MTDGAPRPSEVCRQLLAALGASDGRRRRRMRDTTPDAIGLDLKRRLLEAAARADPEPEAFEAWLLEHALGEVPSGPASAMAQAILEEWRQALAVGGFRAWLAHGAPSDDA